MAFSGNHGISLYLNKVPRPRKLVRNDTLLFSESASRFLVEVPEKHREDFEASFGDNDYAAIGRVEKDEIFCIYGLTDKVIIEVPIAKLRNRWKSIQEVHQ
jgi:phosphoribosylformylglycinamidine synthase